jgi:hypothetical protein
MRHDWIFQVLEDLQDYALANGLPRLALKAEEALDCARREIAAVRASDKEGLNRAPGKPQRPVH